MKNMRKVKSKRGILYILIILLLPTIYWLVIPRNEILDGNILPAFGEISGILGVLLFSINLILSTRLKVVEKVFDGLNDVYAKHNTLGQISLMLLMLHPLLLIPRYAADINDAAKFIMPSPNNVPKTLGSVALSIMMFLIVLTLYLRPKYNLWKVTHKFLGLAFFVASIHVYLIPGYILTYPILKLYILFFILLGIISFLYKTVFEKYTVKKYKYSVNEIRNLNKDILEISLVPLREKIKYKPGQFIFIKFKGKGIINESHPFSIVSAPNEDELKIAVKNLGDYTSKLKDQLSKGTIADIEEPYGVFTYKNKNPNQIWIAGGIGITPFISMVKDIVLTKDKEIKIDLYYCVHNERECVYLDILKSLPKNINLITYYSDENKHIDADYILNNSQNVEYKDILICAPVKMVQSLKAQFIKEGINKKSIYSEEFAF